MQVQNNVHFGAKYISPATIGVKAGKYWKDVNVSFVKLDTASVSDRKVLEQTADLWQGKNLSAAIAEEAKIMRGKSDIYAVTTQMTQHENLMPIQILGLMSTGKLTKKQNITEVFKIGTHPNFAYEQKHRSREIKHIAKGMLEAFKNFAKEHTKAPVAVNYAEPHEMKFLQRVGLDIKNPEVIEILGK